MKKMCMMVMMAVLLLVGAAQVLAEGDCDRSAWGHDEDWQSYVAGSEILEVRTCVSNYGRQLRRCQK